MFKSVRYLLFFFAICAALPVSAEPRAEHVFIISIDGGSPAEIQKSEMPVLKKMVEEGAHSWSASTIRMSITLPSHTSMLTGVDVKKHKITWNNWSPTNGLVVVPTVFAAAKKAGYSTAMFVGKEKFRHLLQPGTVDEFNLNRASSVEVTKSDSGGTEDVKKEGNVFAKTVAKDAAAYIIKNKPSLTFIHFTDPDTVGHKFGWGSPEQRVAFIDTDNALGTVLDAIRSAGIAASSVVIISADHGGHDKGHSKGLPEDIRIPWIVWGSNVKPAFEIAEAIDTIDTATTALWLLDIAPISPMEGKIVKSAFK